MTRATRAGCRPGSTGSGARWCSAPLLALVFGVAHLLAVSVAATRSRRRPRPPTCGSSPTATADPLAPRPLPGQRHGGHRYAEPASRRSASPTDRASDDDITVTPTRVRVRRAPGRLTLELTGIQPACTSTVSAGLARS